MGLMRILDDTGDSVVTWDPADATSVATARRCFDEQRRRARYCVARRPGEPAALARPLVEFDPTVEEMIWMHPVVAG